MPSTSASTLQTFRGLLAHRREASGSLMLAADELYDVDDGPLLRKRRMVMTMCTVQIVVSLALLANARRNPVLLALNPFFLAAGALGYVGWPVSYPKGSTSRGAAARDSP